MSADTTAYLAAVDAAAEAAQEFHAAAAVLDRANAALDTARAVLLTARAALRKAAMSDQVKDQACPFRALTLARQAMRDAHKNWALVPCESTSKAYHGAVVRFEEAKIRAAKKEGQV